MSRLFEPLHNHSQKFANLAQPVIVAMGTSGLTGGALAAVGIVADRMWRRA